MSKSQGPDNSGKLFDNIKRKYRVTTDTALADIIDEHVSAVSAIRNGKREISDKLLVRICENTGITLKSARAQIAARD